MDQCEYVAPLPDDPGSNEMEFIPACPPPLPPNEEPPPPPLQTSSDAEVMDVGSGGDGQSQTPAGDLQLNFGAQLLTKGSSSYKSHPTVIDQLQSDQSPRTARHAAVKKFTPDLKLLKDVKISVSFTESCRSKDRKVLYTGAEAEEQAANDSNNTVNGELHVCPFAGSSNDKIVNNHEIANKRNEEVEADQEKKVEYAVLDDLEDFTENVMEIDEDGAEFAEFVSEAILQRDKIDDESLIYNYEVCVQVLTLYP